jgi:hypothetical protein
MDFDKIYESSLDRSQPHHEVQYDLYNQLLDLLEDAVEYGLDNQEIASAISDAAIDAGVTI